MAVLLYAAGLALLLAILIYSHVHMPKNMPKNIPVAPFYISLLGLWSNMGQDEIYDRWLRQSLEKYGAIRIWVSGRWNVLVTRPDYVSDMFRNEDIYAKWGSQKKIPWTVIASLVGDNIVNSHGETWKLYSSVMKPGLQKTTFDSKPLLEKSRQFVSLLYRTQQEVGHGNGVMVNPLIQRFTIAAMGESFFDIDFQVRNPRQDTIE